MYRELLDQKAASGGRITQAQNLADEEQGICQITMVQTRKSVTFSASTITSQPKKDSQAYLLHVLEPRGVKITAESFEPDIVDSISLPPTPELAQRLGAAYVDFDSNALAELAQLATGEYNEAQWTIDVYHRSFLLSNALSTRHGVKRMAQHPYTWSGEKQNTTIPPAMDFDRRGSGLGVYSPDDIWFGPNNKPNDKPNTYWPDHSYFILPELEHDRGLINNYTHLPAFRSGLARKGRMISGPSYLLTEEKSSVEDETGARQYLAFIGSSLLQERLLLRYLTDEAQEKSEVQFDDSLCVYLITNCGPVSTVYEMKIRDENPRSKNQGPNKYGNKASVKKYVRFDMRRLNSFNTSTVNGCDDLKKCVNFIHWWGLTVHKDAIMTEGLKAIQSDYCRRGGWERGLSEKAFFYTSNGIGFTTSGLQDAMAEPMHTAATPTSSKNLTTASPIPSSRLAVR